MTGFHEASCAAEKWLALIDSARMLAENGDRKASISIVANIGDELRSHSGVLIDSGVSEQLSGLGNVVRVNQHVFRSAHAASLSIAQRWFFMLFRIADAAGYHAAIIQKSGKPFDPKQLSKRCQWEDVVQSLCGFEDEYGLNDSWQNLAELIVSERSRFQQLKSRPGAVHSIDFASVDWFGTKYTFTANQAACVKVLWQGWEKGTPEIGQAAIQEAADISQELRHVFRDSTAWNAMIVPGESKGRFRLKEPSGKIARCGKTHG